MRLIRGVGRAEPAACAYRLAWVWLPATVAPMDTVRWGIIGVGDVTEVKSGPALQQADRSALVAVMRRSADKAADYARRHGVPRWYDDADALIADPEVGAVYIATPPDSHLEYALRVAAAGKPVYVGSRWRAPPRSATR
jgi:hypothetical protein